MIKRSTVIYTLLTVLIIAIALFGLSKNGGAVSNMLLTNTAREPISDVTITDGVNSWQLGDLASGESTWLQERVQGEGPPTVIWQWEGQTYQGNGCDSAVLEGQLEIKGQSIVVVDCR